MEASSDARGVQAVVFTLVAATFLTVYVTQPVLPILRAEFGVTPGIASLTVSAVVLGIALANLPFGVLADRFPVRPIVVAGGAGNHSASIPGWYSRSVTLPITRADGAPIRSIAELKTRQ